MRKDWRLESFSAMAAQDQTIAALRDAVALAPGNVALRSHLVDLLESAGLIDEAKETLQAGIDADPGNSSLRLSLAQLLFRLNDPSYGPLAASFQDEPECPPAAMLLFARWKAASGDLEISRSAYTAAISADASLGDSSFEELLGAVTDTQASPAAEPGVLEKPKTTFADVGGMEPVKEAIRQKIIYPMRNPDLYRAYGRGVGGGILMYGPPGVGKTFLARATAGETASHFIAIGITDVLDMYLGESERQLHALFTLARRNVPCVLFFDEVDALAAKRVDLRGSAGRTLVNQFLAELDNVKTSNEGVLVLAATNAPWHLDSAFRRPGRFDRIIFVPPPDAPARAEILRLLCAGKPADKLDFAAVAKKTDGFTGADLRALVDSAIERKLAEALRQGSPVPLQTSDLSAAAASIKPSAAEWFASARNYALYANEGGIYDDIVAYLKI